MKLVACAITLSLVVPQAALAANAVAGQPSGHEAAEAGRWAFAIAAGFLIVGLPVLFWIARGLFWGIAGRGKGTPAPKLLWGKTLVIGQDNRFSTSKTTALLWTYTVAVALGSFVIAKWLGHPGGLAKLEHQGLDAKYALLIGGPLGAAILAKGIVTSQLESGASAKPPADSATPAQLVQNDEGGADLGDLQYLLFNTVALLFFYGEFMGRPQGGLPTIPDVLVGLTSVAAAGYVGKKALKSPGTITEVTPSQAPVGEQVTLVTSGIVQSSDDLSLVTVMFGSASARPVGGLAVTATQGVLFKVEVPAAAAGKVGIIVSVPNGKSAGWPTFQVRPRVTEAIPARARRGERIMLAVTGISSLPSKAHSVKVTINGKPADVEAVPEADDRVSVGIPADVPVAAAGGAEPGVAIVSTTGGESEPFGFTILP